MIKEKYLKDKSYYDKLYDKSTVYHCRKTEEAFEKVIKGLIKKDPKVFDKKKNVLSFLRMQHFALYPQTGEYYINKEKTIQKWMDRDRQKDKFFEIKPPLVYCSKCNNEMKFVLKNLESEFDNTKTRVYFLYSCKNCKEKRGVYNTGEEYIFKGDFCPKCDSEWNSKDKREKEKIISKYYCDHCGYKKTEVLDLEKPIKEFKEKKDSYFAKDRQRFCLSEKAGQDYLDSKPQIERIGQLLDEWKDKEKHKAIYEKVQKMKKLTVVELSDLLSKKLKGEHYQELAISNPELGRELIVSFTIQDAKPGRVEYDSKLDLKKLLQNLLENTNWKLMSDGLYYQLGVLCGRLKGQDNEDDIYQELKKIHQNKK